MLKKYEAETRRLQAELNESQLEAGRAKCEVSSVIEKLEQSYEEEAHLRYLVDHNAGAGSEATTIWRSLFLSLLVTLTLFALAFAIKENESIMNTGCSPVRPGTKLFNTDSVSLEAPWWVPHPYKDQVFSVYCDSRVRSSVEIRKGKAYLYDLDKGETLWTRKISSSGVLTIESDKISLNKKGRLEEFTPPWSTENRIKTMSAQRAHTVVLPSPAYNAELGLL